MDTIASNDGTLIACERGGSGPPLLLVHGTSASRARWARVLPALQQAFTVYAMDRRGRGASGDTAPYAMQREFEDVAVLVEAIGEPVHLLGHSFGAICSAEAALHARGLRSLTLYEPPMPSPGGSPLTGELPRLQAVLAAGNREEVLRIFFREMNGMPQEAFEQFKTLPEWPMRLAAAHTLPREIAAVGDYRFDAARFASLQVPVLLMLGGDSPPYFSAAIDMLQAAMPRAKRVVLAGQRHVAMDTAPDLFVREVREFIAGL